MATALNATEGKANFQRLTRLLVCGGITLLREVFDSIHPPAVLPLKLGDPTIKAKLQTLRHQKVLTQPEWNQLYPSPGVYGESTDFDITLLFKLFRNVCGLTAPGTGWNDLPNNTNLSLEADLVRIKYYRNHICHSKTMEISDPEFVDLWTEISEALLRIAGIISNVKRFQWQLSIDTFLHDPMTPDAERHIAELDSWYKNDMVVKDELEKLRNEMKQMKVEQQEEMKKIIIHIFTETFTPCRPGSSCPVSTGHLPGDTPQPQETQLQSGSVCVPISSHESQTEGAAAVQPTHAELQANRQTPSTVLDFWHVVFSFKKSIDVLIEYLRTKLGLDVVHSRLGSLLITVTSSSLEVVGELWEDYSSGHLNKVIQETLVTPDLLTELDVSEVTLKTIILEDEVHALFEEILKNKSAVQTVQAETKSTFETDECSPSVRPEDSGFSVDVLTAISEDGDESRDVAAKMAEAELPLRVRAITASPLQTKETWSDYHSLASLPFQLRNALIILLDPPSLADWRHLAVEFGLSSSEIQWLGHRELIKPHASPTDALLRMMEAQEYPLRELADTLRKLERNDAAQIIEEHLSSLGETSVTHGMGVLARQALERF